MLLRAIPAPLWFVAALVPMVASQIVRLQQSDPATWIFWDYAGRLGALAVLGAIPSARIVTFRWERLRMARWEAAFWIVGIVLVDHYLAGWIRRTIYTALPATVLGAYPEPHGWLHIVDVVFGLALVAYSEEIVFRRCARHLFQIYLNDGYALVVVTSMLLQAELDITHTVSARYNTIETPRLKNEATTDTIHQHVSDRVSGGRRASDEPARRNAGEQDDA
jgi:CAAX protease family protein